MDGSAFRSMDLGGAIRLLFLFAAIGSLACVAGFLWLVFLILTWIF